MGNYSQRLYWRNPLFKKLLIFNTKLNKDYCTSANYLIFFTTFFFSSGKITPQ
jgi:hypothetical protein